MRWLNGVMLFNTRCTQPSASAGGAHHSDHAEPIVR